MHAFGCAEEMKDDPCHTHESHTLLLTDYTLTDHCIVTTHWRTMVGPYSQQHNTPHIHDGGNTGCQKQALLAWPKQAWHGKLWEQQIEVGLRDTL